MGTLTDCWQECEMVQPLRKTVWWFLTKLNILLLYDLEIVLLGIYPNVFKTYIHTKTFSGIFIEALSMIART